MDLQSDFDVSVPVGQLEINMSVYNWTEKILNLHILSEKSDDTGKQQSKPCNIFDISWLFEEKCNIIHNIKKDLVESESNLLMSEGEMYIELYDTLVKENKQQKQTLEHSKRKLYPLEENLTAMRENLSLIELSESSLKTGTINTPEMLDVELLLKNSGKKLKKVREDLHTILNTIFEYTSTNDLIKDLTIAYFKGGEDKYINLLESTHYSMCDVNMLKRSGLVVTDPYNIMRIKISDII